MNPPQPLLAAFLRLTIRGSLDHLSRPLDLDVGTTWALPRRG